jgi:hypothetical protein
MDRATHVSAVPSDSLVLDSPSVSPDGTLLTVTVRANPGAAIGPRVLQVTTPGGISTSVPSPENTLNLFAEARGSAKPLVAPLVGVTLGEVPVAPVAVPALPAALLGIQVGAQDVPARPSLLASAPSVGVAVGPMVDRIEAPPLALGGTYVLRIFGKGMDAVDGAGIFPGLDVAVSRPVPSQDGTQVTLSFTISPDARLEPRELRLVAGPLLVPFANPALAVLRLGPGVPQIDSIQPIVAQPGDTVELVVRGHNLQGAVRVLAEPAEGLELAANHGVNADGTELRIRMHVSENASTGPRTLRVQAPGGTSTGQASPANTFTVY